MRGLATFIMKGRGPAILAICALTVFSWLVSLASLLSSAAVALPTLRQGPKEGAIVLAAALAVMTVISGVVFGVPLGAGYALVLWGPMWLLAALLRESARLGWALSGAGAVGIVLVTGIYAAYDHPAALWLEEMRGFLKPMLERGQPGPEAELLWQSLSEFSRYMTGVIAAGLSLSLALSLLIARWWQAMLYNPGGFRSEFLALRLPSGLAYLVLSLMLLAGFAEGVMADIAWNLALPPSLLFLLTGFAVLHALFSGSASGGFWLAGIYVALLFISPLIVVIALIGFSDTWIDWRQRFAAV